MGQGGVVVGAGRYGANLMFALKTLQPIIPNLSAALHLANPFCPAFASKKHKAREKNIVDSKGELTKICMGNDELASNAIFPTYRIIEDLMPMVSIV